MVFAILLCLIIFLVYFLNKHLFSYWSSRGIAQIEPQFFFGNAGKLFKLKVSMGEFFSDLYGEHKNRHKLLGVYFSYKPVILINDPKLVQHVMISDFVSFHDRPMPVNEEKDPLTGHLFNIAGQKWRDMRVKLSPTFTSGKLKGMFPVIKNCSQVLEDYLVKNVRNGTDVFEFRDLMARFNTNIISSVAFGIDNDCINEPDHIFRRMGAKFFEPTLVNGLKGIIAFMGGQKLFHKLKLKSVSNDVEEFIFSIVNQTLEYREKNNYSRNDFMQLLIELKANGYVSVDKADAVKSENQKVTKMTINEIAAQTFVFFIAGFETSSSTMSFALFELAKNPETQKKAQEEIDRVFKSVPDGISYDALSELKYLECCIDETLRKYPIVPIHMRIATKDFKVPDSDIIIEKGTSTFIPVLGMHRDPEIYDDPMKFIPERFLNSSNGGGKVKGLFYTPFGDGPRNCIGMRMGKLTTKIGLAIILSKFYLELNDKKMLDKELEFDPKQFVLTPLKTFDIKIFPR